jgi:hypothetical protein
MSRSIVRRLTATLILAAVLGLAAPAVAAPVGRFQVPAVTGSGLLDQLLAWVASLWPGHQPQEQRTVMKSGTLVSGSGVTGTDSTYTSDLDRSGMLDPNG